LSRFFTPLRPRSADPENEGLRLRRSVAKARRERERIAPVAMSMPRSRRCVDECVNERCVDQASARTKRVASAGAAVAAAAAAASAVAVAAS